jgi:hypothetical protein
MFAMCTTCARVRSIIVLGWRPQSFVPFCRGAVSHASIPSPGQVVDTLASSLRVIH